MKVWTGDASSVCCEQDGIVIVIQGRGCILSPFMFRSILSG